MPSSWTCVSCHQIFESATTDLNCTSCGSRVVPSETLNTNFSLEFPTREGVVVSPDVEPPTIPFIRTEVQGPGGYPVIPGYEIEEILGCGGMGVVYKAFQAST